MNSQSDNTSKDQPVDELLYKYAPDITDVQHIKLRQALRDEVLKAIGEDEKHLRTRFSQCDFYEHMEESECTCGASERNDHRYELRTAISTIFEGKK